MRRLKDIIEKSDTRAGRAFDLTIQLLILFSITAAAVETLPGHSVTIQSWFRWIELVTIALFTLEYLARLWVADSRRQFIFSFYGMVDLLAILPFFFAAKVDLSCLRAFRLLRLFLIFKLLRYSQAIRRYRRALSIVKEELVLFSVVAAILLYLSAVGIHYFEHEAQPEAFASVFHSLWWAVVTLTTVGYGDTYPITLGGRIFTFLVLMTGLGVVAVPTGLVASALSSARALDEEDKRS